MLPEWLWSRCRTEERCAIPGTTNRTGCTAGMTALNTLPAEASSDVLGLDVVGMVGLVGSLRHGLVGVGTAGSGKTTEMMHDWLECMTSR